MRSLFFVMFLVVIGSALTLVTGAQDQGQDQNPKGVIKGIVIDEVPDYEGADFEQDKKKIEAVMTGGVPAGKWKEGLLFEGIEPQPWLKSAANWFPNTEKVQPDEMRITFMGTAPMLRPGQMNTSVYIELGNGDSFIFDMGTGSTDRLAGLEADYSKLDKVFISHLHTDHAGDVAALWVAGWIGGRYTPLQVYGPSSSSPELGIETHIDHVRGAWAWDVTSRAGTLPNAGGEIVAHEFDFSKTAVIYNENGVEVTSYPAIHIRDGSVGFRLDWNGLSFVFGGDSTPTKWFLKEAKGADVVVHEAFFTPEQWMEIAGFPYKLAYWVTTIIHTPPEGFGKLMSLV